MGVKSNDYMTKKVNTSIHGTAGRIDESEAEPERGQTLLTGCLAAFRYIVIIFTVSIILAGMALTFANDVFAFIKDDVTATIVIDEDDSIGDIASKLKNEKIISYPFLFKFYMKITDNDKDIVPGTYELGAAMDYRAIGKKIGEQIRSRESIDVVVPEGMTQKAVFALLEEKGVCSVEDLTEAAANYDFSYSWVMNLPKGEKRLEGYLFPDTYTFYIGDKASRVINKFLSNFNSKYDVDFKTRVSDLESSLGDIIIIASMIEAEAKTDADRPYISSVIYNRLNSDNFKRLQIDATVQYALKEHKEFLTNDDLKIDSPYNTYVVEGLPIGPICNPGLESIMSALYPEDTGYYFYVAKPDGSHIFSKTLAEHEAAIEQVKKEAADTETESGD